MTSPLYPSKTFRYVLKKGMTGHEIAALQLLLNETRGENLTVDGDFGAKTDTAVRKLQTHFGITVDGIAGVSTQTVIGRQAIIDPPDEQNLPPGLLQGIVEGESGYAIGCVNWSVPPGVDCGLIQDRVFDPANADPMRWRVAFGMSSLQIAASDLRVAKDRFYGKVGAKTHQRAWELAGLNHNWPAGAANLANGKPLSTHPATWVTDIGVRGVTTPAEWAAFYIERVTALVTAWTA